MEPVRVLVSEENVTLLKTVSFQIKIVICSVAMFFDFDDMTLLNSSLVLLHSVAVSSAKRISVIGPRW